CHRIADEARLLVALDLEPEARDNLPPAGADLVDRDDLGLGAHPRAGRPRPREPDLGPAVVDPERETGRGDQLGAKAVDEGEGEVAVGDRGPERTLVFGPLDVDVDPLI